MYLQNKFIGVWKLKQWEYIRAGRPVSYPFGKNAEGMLIYSRQGSMSAILMKPDRVKESEDGYVSYGGHYEVNRNFVEHHVSFSLRPDWIGRVLKRSYDFRDQGSTLILTTQEETNGKGETVLNILTWTRDEFE